MDKPNLYHGRQIKRNTNFCLHCLISYSQLYPPIKYETMWANAQRDGRPAEHSWHPLFNAAKFGWRPLLERRAVTKPRRETR